MAAGFQGGLILSLTFRQYLRHFIPPWEIINGDCRVLSKLQLRGERVGVIIRHGKELLYWANSPDYFEDESFPPVSRQNSQAIPCKFNKLYVMNCAAHRPDVIALPKGISPHLFNLQLSLLRRVEKDLLVYNNYSMGHSNQPLYTLKRKRAFEKLRDREWITFENLGNEFGTYDLSAGQYLSRLARHRFVISPEGNGVDCHRTWEALYLKTIPVVKRCPEMLHFSDLPILFVNDFGELTPEFLEQHYRAMLDRTYNIGKLYQSYWTGLIKESISKYTRIDESS